MFNINVFRSFFSWHSWVVVAVFAPHIGFTGPLGYSEDQWVVRSDVDAFFTNANYDGAGNSYRLFGDNRYQNILTTLGFRYDFSDRVSIFSGLSGAYAKATSPLVEQSRTTLTEGLLGADFAIPTDFLTFIPEIRVVFPFNPVDVNSNGPLTGDGVFVAQGGMFMSKDIQSILVYLYGGYRYRSGGLSGQVPWAFHVAGEFGRFLFDAELGGAFTVAEDSETYTFNGAARRNVVNRSSAGSYRYYSLNPSLVEAKGLAGVRIGDRFTVQAGFGKTVTGTNSADGYSILGGLSVAFDAPKGRGRFSGSKSRSGGTSDEESGDENTFQLEESVEPDLSSGEKTKSPETPEIERDEGRRLKKRKRSARP